MRLSFVCWFAVACGPRGAPARPEPTCCCEYQNWSPTTLYERLAESKCEAIDGRCVLDTACATR